MNRRTLAAPTIALAALLALGACASDAEETPAVTPAPSVSPTATASSTPTVTATIDTPTAGTREAPLAIGETRKISEESMWIIGLTASNLDAAGAIRAADENAPQPAEGERFIVATLQVIADAAAGTAQGVDIATDGADPRASLYISYVAADGTSYEPGAGSFCYTGNDFNTVVGSMYQDGATASGDYCIVVPADKAEGGQWRVANSVNDSVWIAAS